MGMTLVGISTAIVKQANKVNQMTSERILRTAFTRANKFESMDTCSIEMVGDYRVLETLYSPLIQFSRVNGQLYTSAAEYYEIKDNWIHFKIREDIVTVDGYRVSAKDAAFSLKRLLLCNSNMHGKVAHFLDVGPIQSINDDVDGIHAEGMQLNLRIKAAPQLVLSFLSTIDFAIIPIKSVDPTTLRIKEKRNTTGPYYLKEGDDRLLFTLQAQKNHWALTDESPEKIEVLKIESAADIPNAFIHNRIDFVGQSIEVDDDKKIEIFNSKAGKDIQLHVTDPLFLMGFEFTEKGLKLSPKERRFITARIQSLFTKNHLPKINQINSLAEASTTIVVDYGFGGLKRLKLSDCIPEQPDKIGKIRIAVHPSVVDSYRESLKEPDLIEVVPLDLSKSMKELRSSTEFELLHSVFDIANKEDTSLISMLFKKGLFPFQEESTFMESYLKEPSEQHREEMFEALHFKALCTDPTIIPLARLRSVSISQNGWHIPFHPAIIGTPFFDLRFQGD